MSTQRSSEVSAKSVRRYFFFMTLGYAAIIIITAYISSFFAFEKTDKVLKNKVISMSASLNVQMKLNMNSYLERMETIGALAFSVEEAYKYDASDPDNDEYEAINTEKLITDKLYSLCIMDNFVDYGIVYRNNRTVGKISNGTSKLFGSDMFGELSSIITRKRTKDGWSAGYMDNYNRIYYVKRVHDNAVLVLSFYTSELESVFDNPETLRGMDIRLVNNSYNILYSTKKEEIGHPLPDDIYTRTQGMTSASVMDDKYLVSINSCGYDWHVICSVPTSIILEEKQEAKLHIYMVGAVAALLAVILGTVLSARMTRPVKKAVTLLDTKAHTDQLTDILNKQSFNDMTAKAIAEADKNEKHALILLDIDDFKSVNDTLGHGYGDKVLIKTGKTLKSVFTSDDIMGRIGGDEFCVFVKSISGSDTDYMEAVREKCKTLCRDFENYYTGSDGKYKISSSIGVSVFPDDGKSFEELYAASDKALYRSKKAGKDTYSFFADCDTGEVDDK